LRSTNIHIVFSFYYGTVLGGIPATRRAFQISKSFGPIVF